MSDEQLNAFLEKVKGDAALQQQLKAAADADAVVAIAKAAGFMISVDELKIAQAEVSEEELESVAGGRYELGRILREIKGEVYRILTLRCAA